MQILQISSTGGREGLEVTHYINFNYNADRTVCSQSNKDISYTSTALWL